MIQRFQEKSDKIETLNKRVKQFKTSLKSGKHIDVFFDNLIQSLINLHNHTKEAYRENLESKISSSWEEGFEKQTNLNHFLEVKKELDEFTE